MATRIRKLDARDWEEVRRIYLEGIGSGNATFETSIGGWQDWHTRFLPSCRLIVEVDGRTAGWAALSAYSSRPAYRGVAEVSVYVETRCHGRGLGKQLLQALVQASESEGFWTLQAGIFSENVASIQLHRSCGFAPVGVRNRIGQLRGSWRDVLLLERRSRVVGN